MSINFSSKYRCAGCGQDIYSQATLRVRCAECLDLDLCLECFASQVEVGSHKNDHAYRFFDHGDFSPLNNDWSAKENLQLLDGLEQFGYGNWNDISRYVETKGPSECRDAVINLFVEGPVGHHTWNEKKRGSATDHTNRNPLLPPPQAHTIPADLSLTELIVLGFMPKRDDFEVEFENDAEMLVSSLLMGSNAKGEEDEEVETALKLSHIDIYKIKMRERERRKQVARDHGLVQQFFKENPISSTGLNTKPVSTKNKRKDPKTDFTERLKIVAEFQGVKEHKDFMASMIKEKDLKSRIKELSRYRKNGINSLSEAEDYESQRIKRNKRKADRKKLVESGATDNSISRQEKEADKETASVVVDLDRVTSIVGLPGYSQLSANEKKLCTSLRLVPNLYISYKTCLLRDHLQKKKGQIPKPVHPQGLDKLHRKKIFNFLLHSGWISAY